MSGYGPFDGLAVTAAAIAVILLSIVSLAGSSTRRRNVEAGQARAQDLCELTGITDPGDLQDVFGPPDMNRTWRHVTLADIARARRPMAHLISNDGLDWACMGVALVGLVLSGPIPQGLVLGALVYQVMGWLAATRLPR